MKKLIFYILLIFFALHANAQVKENLKITKNPKIGLSLSGGGAKGFAHVGVLKVPGFSRCKSRLHLWN